MDYREMFGEKNREIRERFDRVMDKIGPIGQEFSAVKPFEEYFIKVSDFIVMIEELYETVEEGRYRSLLLPELEEWNQMLYQDILPGRYEESYANPSFASDRLGDAWGPLMAGLYAEIRGQIAFAMESRLTEITVLNELFADIFDLFRDRVPDVERVKERMGRFYREQADLMVGWRTRELLDPKLTFGKDIVQRCNLEDMRYLYFYGEYVSEEEKKIADFLNHLPQETIDKMAGAYTQGYQKGFAVMGKKLEGKKSVAVIYELGFERMARRAMELFKDMGLEAVIFRAPVWSVNKNPNRKRGFYGSSPNKQYEYDHRYDTALYLDKEFTDHKAAVLKAAYERVKQEGREYGGPAVIETFGEEGFKPLNKKEALSLSRDQEKLTIAHANECTRISNDYVPGDETSFTIIAFPKPSIGKDFKEIFEETIRINTLDYEEYKRMQQAVIDRLDKAEYVVITGRGENKTDLKVNLHKLADPAKETNFENCVADVNIPVGEVFTSPVLKGTKGRLEVGSVYIGNFQFKNLVMEFEDGKVVSYGCDNFEDKEAGRALVKQVIMKNHDTLPIGEFAIGTNTVAYAMAQRFGIVDKLPILIVEKMGPHFAVGDTCYNWSEDTVIYNPDGKEIIAKDNEISILRKEDVGRAYFSCHTDITIPYSELGEIYGVDQNGEKLPVIADGRFVVPGAEKLNEAL